MSLTNFESLKTIGSFVTFCCSPPKPSANSLCFLWGVLVTLWLIFGNFCNHPTLASLQLSMHAKGHDTCFVDVNRVPTTVWKFNQQSLLADFKLHQNQWEKCAQSINRNEITLRLRCWSVARSTGKNHAHKRSWHLLCCCESGSNHSLEVYSTIPIGGLWTTSKSMGEVPTKYKSKENYAAFTLLISCQIRRKNLWTWWDLNLQSSHSRVIAV